MRMFRAAKLALQAEMLLLRRHATGFIRRAVYGAVAGVFALCVLVILHMLSAMALVQYAHLGPIGAVAIVGGVDLAVAVTFALLAGNKVEDPSIIEARMLRDQSIGQVRSSMTSAAVTATVFRMVRGRSNGRNNSRAVRRA